MQISKKIFKAYDIRGLVDQELTAEVVEQIARSFGSLIISENPDTDITMVISRDMRLTSEEYSQIFIKTCSQMGINCIDIGLNSTPTFYFAVSFLQATCGVQVSASHNGPEYNGFKFVRKNSEPVAGNTGIYEMYERINAQNFISQNKAGEVKTHFGILEENIEEHLKMFKVDLSRPLKIVMDPANSMGAVQFEKFFENFPQIEFIKINWELDGAFPAHEADPMKPENLTQLSAAVKNTHADFGIATDGDCDRVMFVDENGDLIDGSIMRGIAACEVLKRAPNTKIAFDVRPGQASYDIIKYFSHLNEIALTPAGHSLIKEQMLREQIGFAVESSGHFFYQTPRGVFECPYITVMDFLNFVSKNNKKVSELVTPYRKYFSSGEQNFHCDSPKHIIEKIKKHFSSFSQNQIDGVLVSGEGFMFLVRSSNTEPLIRVIVESNSQEKLETLFTEIKSFITL